MPLPSLHFLKGSECSRFCSRPPSVCESKFRGWCYYLRALCWASYRMKYKVKMVVQRNGKPNILAAECDKICPAGKSVCCCRLMVVIWKLDEISRNKKVQPTDNRRCTSKPRKWGVPGNRTLQHKPSVTEKRFNPRLPQTSKKERFEVSIPRCSIQDHQNRVR